MSLVHINDKTDPIFATPDSIEEIVATFPLASETPQDVIDLLDLSRKLLRTCVIHYEFAAVATEKSLQALELAIRLYLKAGAGVTLENLIKELGTLGIFSTDELLLFNYGRKLRNEAAHPTSVTVYPLIMAVTFIRTNHLLISKLFATRPSLTDL